MKESASNWVATEGAERIFAFMDEITVKNKRGLGEGRKMSRTVIIERKVKEINRKLENFGSSGTSCNDSGYMPLPSL